MEDLRKSFEGFYKTVSELLDTEKDVTEEQKAQALDFLEGVKSIISPIGSMIDEMGLTEAERYIMGYLLDHGDTDKLKSVEQVAALQYIAAEYVHKHKQAAEALYSDAEARATFIRDITDDDIRDIKLDVNADKVKALLASSEPSLDDILEIIGFGNAAIIYDRHNKYRTKAKAREQGAITETPPHLLIPTMHDYQYSMSLYQQGNAYLQPFINMNGLQFKNGKLYFEGGREVSEIELRNLRTREGIQDIDLTSLRFYYSILFDQFHRSNYKVLQDIIIVSVSVLAQRNNPNKEDINNVIAKTQSYHNVMGVLKGTRNGRPTESYYQVLNFEYYDEKHNIIAFSSPYMNYVIQTIFKLSARKDKDGKPKLKRNGEPLRIASHSYLIDSSIAKERNKAAAENVVIIVTLIEQAGDNLPRIKASTIIERNVQLAERLAATKNPRVLLKTTFTKTWELLRTKTRLAEVYKNIKLPDPADPAYMPTMRTLDKVVFEFPHDGKK